MRRIVNGRIGTVLGACGTGLRHQVNMGVQAPKGDAANMNSVETLGKPLTDVTDEGEQFLHIPDHIRQMKTAKLPEDLPKNEAQLTSHPMAAKLQQWFMVPVVFLAYLAYRFSFDPFNDGRENTRTKRQTPLEEHYDMFPAKRPQPTADRDTRRRMREELKD